MSRIKSWILCGCAASSLLALGASKPVAPEHFSVSISPMNETGPLGASQRTFQGSPIVPFSVYHPEAPASLQLHDAIAVAGEEP